MILNNSTVSANKAANRGGGIFADNGGTIRNSTIAFNTAKNGGGIFTAGGTIDIGNSIVAKNTATIAKHTKVGMIWVAGRSPTLVSQNLKATTLTYLAIKPAQIPPPELQSFKCLWDTVEPHLP